MEEVEVKQEGEFVEGFALAGEYVKGLEDKTFEIIDLPIYEEGQDLDNPAKTKRKMVLQVKLANGTCIKYYPNKTSQKVIIEKKGYELSAWMGYCGVFETKSQMVGNQEREVIYIVRA